MPERTPVSAFTEGPPEHVETAGEEAQRAAADAGDSVRRRTTDAPNMGRRGSKTLLMLSVGGVGAAIAAVSVMTRIGDDIRIEPLASRPQAVSAIRVESRTFHTQIQLIGEARPVRDIQVTAPATGVRILNILVDEGDFVTEGQPLAELDESLAAAQTGAARAAVAEAASAATRARGEYERAESIRDSGALSAEAIDQRRAAATAANARLAAAHAQLEEVSVRLGGGYVRAPAAGLVIDRSAELGRPVDGQVLFRIAADNRLEVSAQVAEADALALREGQMATFSLVDGSSVDGVLSRLPASIDSRTRTGEALFALPPDTRVRAGMYVRGRAVLPPREVIAAPQSSVLHDNGRAYVLVVDDASRVRRAEVQVGRRDGDWIEIAQGLPAGRRVVGPGAAFLQDGDEVRILQTDEPTTEQRASAGAESPRPDENIRGRE